MVVISAVAVRLVWPFESRVTVPVVASIASLTASVPVVSISTLPAELSSEPSKLTAPVWFTVSAPPAVVIAPPALSKAIPVLTKSPPAVLTVPPKATSPRPSPSELAVRVNWPTVSVELTVIPSAALTSRSLPVTLPSVLIVTVESSDRIV